MSAFCAAPMKSIALSCRVGIKCVVCSVAQIYHDAQFANVNAPSYASIEGEAKDVLYTKACTIR